MRLIAAAVVVSSLSLLVPIVSESPPVASAAECGPAQPINVVAAGPLGGISVIGDSVLMGAAFEPSLPTLLAATGWGPIRFQGVCGMTAGNYPVSSQFSAASWISQWRAGGWDAPNVAVNLGNNDVGFCGDKGVAECASTIRYLLDVIGPNHQVWWPKITRPYDLAVPYNQALDLVAGERGNLHVWDWPKAQQDNAVALGPDYIHLRDTVAYRTRSVLMAADITSQFAVATRTGMDAPVPVASGPSSEYLPITPNRVLDTRTTGTRLIAGGVQQVDLSPYVPAGTTAVAVNLTSVDPATDGFLTGYACGADRPGVSSANFTAHTNRGALAVLPISSSRTLCVFTSSAADLVVDLQGAFVADASRFTPVTPDRLLDTRNTGRAQVLTLPTPAGADAVALNLTVTGSAVPGFLTAYPCGATLSGVSNVNFGAGETIAGAAFVPVSHDGTVCLFSNTPVDVIVDLTGTFSAGGELAFTPAVPTRVYDTRDGTGGWTPIQGGGQTTDVRVAPAGARAVTGTLTIVTPGRDGFLTAFGCGQVPGTSNVNAPRGGVLANSVTVVLADAGRLCVRALAPTHVVFDTTGWWS